jgi:hypothetical protein
MTLIASVVTSESEFDKICPMDYDGWLVPYNPQLKHFRAYTPNREAAIATQIAKSVKSFRAHDPESMWWVKVEDSDTGEVVGTSVWQVNRPDPSKEPEPTQAYWHPEGSEEREFAERFINGLWGFLGSRVTRPHMGMILIVEYGNAELGSNRLSNRPPFFRRFTNPSSPRSRENAAQLGERKSR